MATVFLKLGGSLLTDKRRAEAPRTEIVARVAQEVASARSMLPDLRLVIGHGSGSYGHVHARRYGTRQGVCTAEEWLGFARTADAAARLNRIVVAALLEADVPAWAIQPSATIRSRDGVLETGPDEAVRRALERGLQPVVFGDVALDEVRGGTIASTEEIFHWLADRVLPDRLVLAGEVDGIYTADPFTVQDATRVNEVTPASLADVVQELGASHGVDVTGGMAAKVEQVFAMLDRHPHLDVIVCSGLNAGAVYTALAGPAGSVGTWIHT